MSLDVELDPYCAVEWLDDAEDALYPALVDVQILSADELADLCEQAFLELDNGSPAPGALQRYQELVDEVEHRQFALLHSS